MQIICIYAITVFVRLLLQVENTVIYIHIYYDNSNLFLTSQLKYFIDDCWRLLIIHIHIKV